MRNIIKNIAIASLAILTLGSCNDWINITPTDRVSDKSAWEEQQATDLYVNNFYEYLKVYGSFGTGQFSGNLTEGLTDVLKYGSYIVGARAGDCNDYVFVPETISASGAAISGWADAYGRIRRINEFLYSMVKYSKYDQAANALYEAQARFFRAYLNFQLAKRYRGNIILYTGIDQIKKDMPLSKPEKVWQAIYDDLKFAADNLPESWDAANSGRLTKYAAYAMLSRTMLYAERWQDAKDAADKVIESESHAYDLMPTYEEGCAGGNKESILEFRFSSTSPSHDWDKIMAMYYEYTTGGSSAPTQEFVEEFEAADGTKIDWTPWHTATGTTVRPPYERLEPRFAASVIYNGCKWKDKTIENCVNGTYGGYIDYGTEPYPYGMTVTGYYVRKFRQEKITDLTNVPSSSTWVELRYSEVLLNRAEACYRLNNATEAVKSLKRVRDRVNLPTDNTLAGDALFAAIRHERKIELFLEGHLWWDMRRWGLAETAYTGYRTHGIKIVKDAAGAYTYSYVDCDGKDRKFLHRMYTMPIPSSELLNNSAVKQFTEWTF